MCHEFFDAAVKFCVENRRFKDATSFLERQIKQYENDSIKYVKRIYRNIISLMIISFALKKMSNKLNKFIMMLFKNMVQVLLKNNLQQNY